MKNSEYVDFIAGIFVLLNSIKKGGKISCCLVNSVKKGEKISCSLVCLNGFGTSCILRLWTDLSVVLVNICVGAFSDMP